MIRAAAWDAARALLRGCRCCVLVCIVGGDLEDMQCCRFCVAGSDKWGRRHHDIRTHTQFDAVLGRGAFKTVFKAFDEEEGIEVAWNQVKVRVVVWVGGVMGQCGFISHGAYHSTSLSTGERTRHIAGRQGPSVCGDSSIETTQTQEYYVIL